MTQRFTAKNGCLLLIAVALAAGCLRLLTTRAIGDDGDVVWSLAFPESRFLDFRLSAIFFGTQASGSAG